MPLLEYRKVLCNLVQFRVLTLKCCNKEVISVLKAAKTEAELCDGHILLADFFLLHSSISF